MLYVDYVLSDEQRALLIDRDVNFSEMTLGTETYHRHGVAFSDEDCEAALEIMGLIKDDRAGTDWVQTPQGEYLEGYFELSLLEMPTPMNPLVWGNPGQRSGYDNEVFQESHPNLGLGFFIEYFRRGFAEYRHRPGVLFVNVFSSPSEEFEIVDDDFGGRGNHVRMVAKDLGSDYITISYRDGRPLAYFRGDADGGSLWILFRTDAYERVLMEYIMHSVARLVNPGLGEVPSFEEYQKVASRERFIGFAQRRLQGEIDQMDSRVDNFGERIEDARVALVRVLVEAETIKHRREELRLGNSGEMLQSMKERLAKEFDDVVSSSDFESLEFRDDKVVAVTRPINLRYKGQIYEMGKYEIRIPREGDIRIFSESRVGHPHLSEGNYPCFGNATESVAKLQAEMSYGLLLPFLVNYLENGYNPADSYTKIEDYKVKNYPEPKEVKKPSKPRHKTAKGKRSKTKKSKKGKEVKNESPKRQRKRAASSRRNSS